MGEDGGKKKKGRGPIGRTKGLPQKRKGDHERGSQELSARKKK